MSGWAIVTRIPMIASTTRISTRVNPFACEMMTPDFPLFFIFPFSFSIVHLPDIVLGAVQGYGFAFRIHIVNIISPPGCGVGLVVLRPKSPVVGVFRRFDRHQG